MLNLVHRNRIHQRGKPNPYLEEVWESEVIPELTANSNIRATSLLKILQQQNPSRFPPSTLRTLQRRLKSWRKEYSTPVEKISAFNWFRYPGGKEKLLPPIMRRLNWMAKRAEVAEYREPFLGGGAVALHFLSQHPQCQ